MYQLFFTIVWLLKFVKHIYQIQYYNGINKLSKTSRKSTLYILGNGKSLNKVLDSMSHSSIDYMVVNRHVLSNSYSIIKPKYYVVVDPFFFQKDEGILILEKIKADTNWEMYLFIPSWRKVVKKVSILFKDSHNIKVVPINGMQFKGYKFLRDFLYKHNLSLPLMQNVLVGAIYAGVCMKYNEINLYGVEHNWTKFLSVDMNNQVIIEDSHFFDKNQVQAKTWYENTGRVDTFGFVLNLYSKMFNSYFELEDFSQKQHVNIYNCTEGSYIDAFKRNKG